MLCRDTQQAIIMCSEKNSGNGVNLWLRFFFRTLYKELGQDNKDFDFDLDHRALTVFSTF